MLLRHAWSRDARARNPLGSQAKAGDAQAGRLGAHHRIEEVAGTLRGCTGKVQLSQLRVKKPVQLLGRLQGTAGEMGSVEEPIAELGV